MYLSPAGLQCQHLPRVLHEDVAVQFAESHPNDELQVFEWRLNQLCKGDRMDSESAAYWQQQADHCYCIVEIAVADNSHDHHAWHALRGHLADQ